MHRYLDADALVLNLSIRIGADILAPRPEEVIEPSMNLS